VAHIQSNISASQAGQVDTRVVAEQAAIALEH
jgi:hypothetical protein